MVVYLLLQACFLLAISGCLTAARIVVVLGSKFNSSDVAADIQLLLIWCPMVILWVLGSPTLSLISSILIGGSCRISSGGFISFEDDGVHAVHRTSVLVLTRKELLTAHGTGYNVAHKRVSLRQVRSEVHLLPS